MTTSYNFLAKTYLWRWRKSRAFSARAMGTLFGK
jgi:hypothetical protein